jgi:hypothetical protein
MVLSFGTVRSFELIPSSPAARSFATVLSEVLARISLPNVGARLQLGALCPAGAFSFAGSLKLLGALSRYGSL